MGRNNTNLKSYCKVNKVKQPKEPYFCMSYSLQKKRMEVLDYLHRHIDKADGRMDIMIPRLHNSPGCLFLENGRYYLSTDEIGKVDLNDLSTDFLGEQLYFAVESSKGWKPFLNYEHQFDEIKSLQEEWMHVIIANKEKRVLLEDGVALQFSGGYLPDEMAPGIISAVYEKDGEFYVCLVGQDDIYFDDLNIDTVVAVGDKLYGEFLPQVSPGTVEEALTLMVLECKSKMDKITLAHNAKTPASMLSLLSEDKNEQVRAAVAINMNTPKEVLAELAGDPNRDVRERVAGNPNTPVHCLAPLAVAKEQVIDFGRERDMCEYIRLAVARNPNTPTEVLEKLAEDTLSSVRAAASERLGAASSRVLDKPCENESKSAPEKVEPEINIPAVQLAKMAIDSDYKIRRQAAQNPNTPADSLALLAKDYYWDVVSGALLNPNTPLKILLGVAALDQKYMSVVVKNPSLPLQSLLEFAAIACYYPKNFPVSAIIVALLDRI